MARATRSAIVAGRIGRAAVGQLLDGQPRLMVTAELPLVGGDPGEAVGGDLADGRPLVGAAEDARQATDPREKPRR